MVQSGKNVTPKEIERLLKCAFRGDEKGVLKYGNESDLLYIEQDAQVYISAVSYLARLYLYAHGDDRSQDVIEVSVCDFGRKDTETIIAKSSVPALFHPYLKNADSAILGGLSVDFADDKCTANVMFPLSWYPNVNLANSKAVINVACFFVFQSLSSVVSVASPYGIDPQTLEWRNVSSKLPIQYAMDAIVGGRVGACPKCGKPVYLTNRKNPKRFCSVTHQNNYHDAAKRMLMHGASVDDVYSRYPFVGSKETVEGWSLALQNGVEIIWKKKRGV